MSSTSTRIISLAVVLSATAALGFVMSGSARSQLGVAKNYVQIQASSPGTAQSGHANISGTMRAGQFAGGGAGLTGLPAGALVGTVPTSTIPVPLSLTGSISGPVLNATNTITSSPSATHAIWGEHTGSTGLAYGVLARSSSSGGRGLFGVATSTSGTNYGVYGQSNSSDGIGVFGFGATGIYGESNSNTTTQPAIRGVNNELSGLALRLDAPNGDGARIRSGRVGIDLMATIGMEINLLEGHTGISIEQPIQWGISPIAISVSTRGSSSGIRSTNTIGPALTAISEGNSASLIGRSTGSIGGTGVSGETSASSGLGIFGDATSSTGQNYGGRFEAAGDSGRGVYGYASNGGASTTPYGVRGQASTATNGFGLYAVGDSGASGVKSFRIDHPHDPLNKYLLHFSSESPFPQNFYNGNVMTDKDGYAWVELPEYFEDINTNFKYQLTVVEDAETEDFVHVKVVQKIRGNRFRIRTSKANVEVSWEVKADRNDDRVRFNRPMDVRDKTGLEKGKYQHPEYHNARPEMGMDYAARPQPALQSGRKTK